MGVQLKQENLRVLGSVIKIPESTFDKILLSF